MRLARRRVDPGPVSIMSSAATGPIRFGSHCTPCQVGMSEHHLRKGEAALRIVERDAVAAGERELEAASHAEPVHQRGGGEGQAREPLEQIPAGAREHERLVGALEAGEFLDVGAGDEASSPERMISPAGFAAAISSSAAASSSSTSREKVFVEAPSRTKVSQTSS